MKKIIIKILNSISKLMRLLWFIIPIVIAFYVGFKFITESFYNTKNTSAESFKILISSIGLAATLSGLSFSASSKCENEDKLKSNFYYAGELLFLSVITFILAFLVNYASVGLIKLESSSKIKLIAQIIIVSVQYALFVSGLSNVIAALTILRTSLDFDIRRKIVDKLKG